MVQMIKLRFAQSEQDCDLLLKWRNDPFIYKRFSNPKPVNRLDHIRWFEGAIMSSSVRLFIIEKEYPIDEKEFGVRRNNDVPVGQIRFDKGEDNTCEVSIGLPERYTGKGWGTEAIRQGCIRIGKIWEGVQVIARFVPQNCPSKKAFAKAGFKFLEEKNTAMVYRP